MPKFHGIPFVWRNANRLRPDDHLLLDDGEHVCVDLVAATAEGIWLEFTDAAVRVEVGYASSCYRLII